MAAGHTGAWQSNVWPTDTAKLTRAAQRVLPGCTLVRAWQLPGGISARMVALEVRGPDGARHKLVMREPIQAHARGDDTAAAREHAILACLEAAGVAVPAPRDLDDTHEIFPFAYLTMDFVEGRMDFAPVNFQAYVAQMAAQLARIHAIPGDHAGLRDLPAIETGLNYLLRPRPAAQLDESLDEPRLRARAARSRPRMARNRPVLLHGDFWPGNLLWRAGRTGAGELAAVVDWEDAATGDPLADVAIARLDLLWILGRAGMDAFTRAYQIHMPGLDYSKLPDWDLYAALRAVSWLEETTVDWAAWGRPDINAASKRAGHAAFIAQAVDGLDSG